MQLELTKKNGLSILQDIQKLKINNVLLEAKKTWNDWITYTMSAVPRTCVDFSVLDIDHASMNPAHAHDEAQFYQRVR